MPAAATRDGRGQAQICSPGLVAVAGYTYQAVRPRTARAIELRGLRPVIGDYARFGAGLVAGLPWSLRGARGRFAFGGEEYPYLYHRYKFTWLTERTVEVPIVRAIVDGRRASRLLEVGNVLPHYGEHTHVVVDKYERAPGVLNRDVLDLADLGRFELIVAISTLEHVGWDEEPRDPGKAVEAVGALRALLGPGGRLVITVPVGYHPGLDAALQDGILRPARLRALRRERLGPHWREVAPDSVWGTPYDFLLYSARAVVVAELEPR
jgi:SAM-dependent methyltransferase